MLTPSVTPSLGAPPAGEGRAFAQASGALGLYAVLAGVVTLIGWFADVPVLANWGAPIAMLPNTALAGMLAGGALLALAARRRRLAQALGAVTGLLGALTLLQHITGVNLGIDTMLVYREWGQRATVSPGRMGPPASMAYTIVGVSLLLAGGGRRARMLVAGGGVLVVSIAVLSLVGYAFGASRLFELPRLTAIAMQTATVVLAIGVGVICAVPDSEPLRTLREDSAAAALVRRGLPFALVVPVLISWLRVSGQEAGLYDSAFGAALRSLVEAGLLIGLLWWAASAVRAHERPLRESREQLEELAEELRLVTDNLPGLISYVGADRRYGFNNRKYEEWFGIPAGSLRGRDVREVIGDDAYERVRPHIESALSGERVQFEDQIKYPTGSRWVQADYIPHIAADGQVMGFYAMVSDITQRKLAEAVLRDSEKRFREMADAAPAMLWVTDEHHYCNFLSRGWYEFTGQTGDEGWGLGWTNAIHPDDKAMAGESFLAAARAGKPYWCDFRLRRTDGTYRWVIDAGRPRYDGDGKFLGYIGSVIDVHERKEAEEAVRHSAEALERSNRELERFVSIASHDLKEPLRGVALLASLVNEDEPALSDESRGRLKRISHLCDRLTGMISGLLEYARLGGERRSEPCDLERIARSALDKMQEQLSVHDARIEILGPLPVIQGDPVLLERMFANLIVNGVKHNRGTGKRVEVFLDGENIAIRDNGPGIDAKYHERIFDLFKRVGAAADDGGVGLGLALVRNIVRSHGGRIWVESAVGQGATFYIHFPGAVLPQVRIAIDASESAPYG